MGLVHMPGLRMHQLEAVATSLVGQSVSALTSGAQWLRSGHCNFTVAACLGLCGLPSVVAGTRLVDGVSDRALKLVSACVMCLMICPITLHQLYMSRTHASSSSCSADSDASDCDVLASEESLGGFISAELQANLQHCAMGCIAGMLTSTVGVGDTPLLMAYMASLGFSQQDIIGTVTVAQAPALAIGALLHTLNGDAELSTGLIFAFGMSAGAMVGARFSASKQMDNGLLQIANAAFTLALGGAAAWTSCVQI